MSRDSRRAPASRCLLLWSVLSACAAGLLLVARAEASRAHREVTPTGSPSFALALTLLATVVLAVSVTWLWCVMTAATIEAMHGVRHAELPGLRGAVRRLVLAGCGVALAASVAPAHADQLSGVAGQPPQPLPTRVHTASTATTLQVAPGDSLWSLSATRLGAGATNAEIDHAWRALWRANQEEIGSEPDLIQPGQRLDVPAVQR